MRNIAVKILHYFRRHYKYITIQNTVKAHGFHKFMQCTAFAVTTELIRNQVGDVSQHLYTDCTTWNIY